ncbi:endoplasmic reticulum-Golgi intermediate compartment protein 3-like [Halichondria panicea]|uniref:endoplasmic reticulum-Golgi intermediate compartment protein 3-like n=1 Tax=Halichondria panicea TaxID=6063 RepID=UPI00312B7BD8
MASGFVSRLKQFDAYPKTLEDFRVKTYGGATITLLSGAIIVILFLSELAYFLSTDIREELYVDTSRGEKMKINFDLSFQRMPCLYLSIDAMDVSGEHQLDVLHSVFKQRLTTDGQPITEEKPQPVEMGTGPEGNETTPTETAPAVVVKDDVCKSCYGAESPEIPCCNTCEQVREAYRIKGWAFNNPTGISQCINEGWTDKIKDQVNEGCNIRGYIEVSKVAGNIHFAPGKSFQQHSVHVHDLQSFGVKKFNFTHTIGHLSFGEDYPGQLHPLNGYTQVQQVDLPTGGLMYQYFIKVVPTIYHKLSGELLRTNQFSVTKHSKEARAVAGHSGLPGVFFMYDLSPMMVQLTEHRRSFTHFLTGVCAIVGGVFTVAGMLDGMLYHSARALRKKIDLGKAS